jgi:hypothetical protein
MNLAEFIDLLNRNKLYFCRVDKFQEMDPWEGVRSLLSNDEQIAKTMNRKLPKYHFASCWHRNPNQSMAMWQIYAEKGIAIKSTKASLKNSLKTINLVEAPTFEDVEYIDILKENSNCPIPTDFFYKLKCYEFEREFRAVIMRTGTGTDENGEINCINSAFVEANLSTLISEIYVSPFAEPFYENVINSLLEKYNLDFRVIRSNIKEMVAW